MKREIQTPQAELEDTHASSVKPVRSRWTRFGMAAGLAIACLQLVLPSASAGGVSPLETADGKRPRAERHLELRKVLSAPREEGVGSDSRRKMSVEERNALRESMRGVYDRRESREERGFKARP